MRVIVGTPAQVVQRLDRGELTCPCGGRLRRWGWARPRIVRELDRVLRVRPRRGRCVRCRCTHVLLPPACLSRRVDSVEVIGLALSEASRGLGSRRIAGRLRLPDSTVRDWIRRFRRRGHRWPPGLGRPGFSWRTVSWGTDGLLLAP